MDSPTQAADRLTILVVFLAALFSYASFFQSTENPNARTRMFLTLALLEQGSTKIDRYHDYTLDRAVVGQHYYSEKAPGLSFTAIPAVAVGLWAFAGGAEMFDGEGKATKAFDRLTWMATLSTSGIFAALAVVAVYLLALEFGAHRAGAGFAAIGLAWGTPLWGWATAFLGHAVAAGCLSLGLLALVLASREQMTTTRHRHLFAATAGALLAWAVVVELIAAGAVVIILACGAWRARLMPGPLRNRLAVTVAIFAAIFLAPLFVYNASAFGAPWHFGYSYTESWYPAMNEGVVGFSVPSPAIVSELLFGRYRGLVWISPLCLAALAAGIWQTVRARSETRVAMALSLSITIYYLLLNSSYAYWDGGWSTGPRHLTASLPFLVLPLAIAWGESAAWLRAALSALLLASAFLGLICVSTSMFAPDFFEDALNVFLLPSFEARIASEPVPRIGAFAFVVPWELAWSRTAGLLAVAFFPLIASAFVAWRARRLC
jgi:hypothetical protein